MAPRKSKETQSLLADALAHIEIATRLDSDYGKFCVFTPNWVTGFDGVIAAGHRIVDVLSIAPRTATLREALKRAGSPSSLTILGDGSLAVSGQRLRVVVPCMDIGSVPGAGPDKPAYNITNQLLNAMQIAGMVSVEKAERTCLASIVVTSGACYGTDARNIIRAKHDTAFHGSWQVPKEFLAACKKVTGEATHIGFGDNTCTVWFGPDKWLRTQLFDFNFPDCATILERAYAGIRTAYGVHQELAFALESIKPFLNGNVVFARPGQIRTEDHSNAASFLVDHGLPDGKYAYDGFRMASLYAQQLAIFDNGVAWRSPTVDAIFAKML